jgi:hypothetical protein
MMWVTAHSPHAPNTLIFNHFVFSHLHIKFSLKLSFVETDVNQILKIDSNIWSGLRQGIENQSIT